MANAFVSQMETEAQNLRNAKVALETAMSKGEPLDESTSQLSDANKAYQNSSALVRKNCSQPKAKAKGKAKAAA